MVKLSEDSKNIEVFEGMASGRKKIVIISTGPTTPAIKHMTSRD